MLKIFPVIILPFVFFFIFSNVGNLTFEKSSIEENLNITKRTILKDEKKSKEEEKVLKSEDNITKAEPKKSSRRNTETNDVTAELENSLNNVKSAKKQEDVPDNVKTKDKYIVQFGAFSKKSNAALLAKKIEKKLIQKFPNFQLIVENDKKNNLFKILFYSEVFDKAEKICNYSKKIGFNCLSIKK